MGDFPCTGCGSCCKRVGSVMPVLQDLLGDQLPDVFPYKANDRGWCEKLVDDRCTVYDSRPILCNIEEMWKVSGKAKEDYYRDNIKSCNAMMDEDNVPISYRISDVYKETREASEANTQRTDSRPNHSKQAG